MGKWDIELDNMFSLYHLYSITHHQYTYTEMEINICTFYMLQTNWLKIMFDMIFLPTKILVKRSNITFFYQGDKSLDIDIQIMRKTEIHFRLDFL